MRREQAQKVAADAEVNEVLDVLVVLQTRLIDRMFACCSYVNGEWKSPATRGTLQCHLIADFSQALELCISLRYPVLSGSPSRADLHTPTGAIGGRRIV